MFKLALRLTAAASATDAAIQNRILGRGMSTLTISNEKINDIMKIVESPKESSLLIKMLVKQ